MKKKWLFTVFGILFLLIIWLFRSNNSQQLAQTLPAPTKEKTPTSTNTPEILADPIFTDTPTPTLTPTATPIACSSLISPEDGTQLETEGKIFFEWTEQSEASNYQLEIFLPDGYVDESFIEIVEETSFQRWLESLPIVGEYQWRITPLTNSKESICTSELFSFEKEQYIPPVQSSSGGSCTPEGWPDSLTCNFVDEDGDGEGCCYDTCGNLMGCGSWGGGGGGT